MQRLRRLGAVGVAAYGVLTTVYYSAAIAFAWFYVAQVPRGIGLSQAVRKFPEVFVSAWAFSQVTKIPRALGCVPEGECDVIQRTVYCARACCLQMLNAYTYAMQACNQ